MVNVMKVVRRIDAGNDGVVSLSILIRPHKPCFGLHAHVADPAVSTTILHQIGDMGNTIHRILHTYQSNLAAISCPYSTSAFPMLRRRSRLWRVAKI